MADMRDGIFEMPTLEDAVRELGEAAKTRNAAAGDAMYDALYHISEWLKQPKPNIAAVQRFAERSLPRFA